jgi:hypothetical protein
MSGIVSTGKQAGRQGAVEQAIKSFDGYQMENYGPTIEQMDEEYLSNEFPPDIANNVESLIEFSTDMARSGIEARVKTLFQAISRKKRSQHIGQGYSSTHG